MLRIVSAGGLAALLLTSAATAQGRRGPGMFGGFQSPALLLGTPEVKKELGTSDEQNKKIDEALSKVREQMRESRGNPQDLRNLSREERQEKMAEFRKKMEEVNKKTDEELGKILDAKQQARLKQLSLQRQGVMAFNRPEVAKELGLTEEQRDKLRKIQQSAFPGFGRGARNRGAGEGNPQERFAQMRKQLEKAQADALAALTDEQKTKWTEMKGKEFKFPEGQGFGGGFGSEKRRPKKKDQ